VAGQDGGLDPVQGGAYFWLAFGESVLDALDIIAKKTDHQKSERRKADARDGFYANTRDERKTRQTNSTMSSSKRIEA
jgi:hypothetical protein